MISSLDRRHENDAVHLKRGSSKEFGSRKTPKFRLSGGSLFESGAFAVGYQSKESVRGVCAVVDGALAIKILVHIAISHEDGSEKRILSIPGRKRIQ